MWQIRVADTAAENANDRRWEDPFRARVKWTFSDTEPYSYVVNFTDGKSEPFSTLERPKLLFNATAGAATHLFNGVCV